MQPPPAGLGSVAPGGSRDRGHGGPWRGGTREARRAGAGSGLSCCDGECQRAPPPQRKGCEGASFPERLQLLLSWVAPGAGAAEDL